MLYRIDKTTLDAHRQNSSTGLAHEDVQELLIAGPDVWASTRTLIGLGGKLCRYSAVGRGWETLASISGSKHDEPTCLAELGGDVWVATRAYDSTKKMVIAWGMVPIEGEAPVLKALALNRFVAGQNKWETFLVPHANNFDRIIAMALEGRRLWFLLERKSVFQSFAERNVARHGQGVIPGYVDTESPRSSPVLFDRSPIPPSIMDHWGGRRPISLVVVEGTVWVQREDELWRRRTKEKWDKLQIDSPLPDVFEKRLIRAGGMTLLSCATATLCFDAKKEQWVDFGIPRPWRVTDVCKDSQGTWWLSAVMGRVGLPPDSERNDEDRKPLQAGLFRSTDCVRWEVPSIAPWTWQHADVEGEVSFLPLQAAKRAPRDLDLWGRTAAEGPRVGARRETQAKAGEGIRCVVSDGTRVWVGTFGDGVLCLEKNQWHRLWPKSVTPATRPVGFVPRAAEDTVTSLALDGDSLWIATLAGLRRYRISERSLETVGENLPAFKPIGDVSYMEPWSALETGPVVAKTAGRIWYSPSARLAKGTTSGVYCLAEDRRNWKCAIPDANGRHFAEAGQYVWIATQDGLLRYDPKTNRQARFTTRDGLTSNTIVSVAADDRYIWVGVASGVSRLNRLTFERP